MSDEDDRVQAARDTLLDVADRVRESRDLVGGTSDDAEREYADELLALAARALVRATDATPPDEQPVGWHAGG
jgi:hypothetical protein